MNSVQDLQYCGDRRWCHLWTQRHCHWYCDTHSGCHSSQSLLVGKPEGCWGGLHIHVLEHWVHTQQRWGLLASVPHKCPGLCCFLNSSILGACSRSRWWWLSVDFLIRVTASQEPWSCGSLGLRTDWDAVIMHVFVWKLWECLMALTIKSECVDSEPHLFRPWKISATYSPLLGWIYGSPLQAA
jgi:hypothetical protein